MKNLVIVESPAKAKTIEKYLGKDFKVLSSVGHIRSIPVKVPKGKKAIDVKNGYQTIYEIDKDKKKVITELKKAVKIADQVWLATDEDREGEAIAWHLAEVLKLDSKTTKRIVFNEITKDAITHAIKHPRLIDMQLVQAQQARQILDRLVGFELSPVVWRKVPGGKSAGRVQSPAVRLIVEKELEIRDFTSNFDFKITTLLDKNEEFNADLINRPSQKNEARLILEDFKTDQFVVDNIESKLGQRHPQPPFTTSSLQQTANSKLGFSSKQTMSAAQKLYQAGLITYMRTDSTNLSQQAIKSAAGVIIDKWGKEFHKSRQFTTKSASAQEAHEAIRPTNFNNFKAGSGTYEQKLYSLIHSRALASQMAPAKIERTTINISTKPHQHKLIAKGEVIVFKGFLEAYYGKNDDKILPKLVVGDNLNLISATAKQTFKKPPARYTEGSLVKKLEELGIGRPSTYATIMETIQKRNYVKKGKGETTPQEIIVLNLENDQITDQIITENTGSDKGRLVPEPIGELLNTFLNTGFEDIVDYEFTANVEDEFDKIATGNLDRNQMLDKFYQPFHQSVKDADGISRQDVSHDREVGIDPKTKLPVIARLGRFGPMLQLGQAGDDKKKPKFAPLPAGASLETVTLEQALKMFKLPRLIGQTKDGKDIKANIGRFGPYIQIDKTFVSIKPHDPFSIDLSTALELYQTKLEADAKKNIASWGEIKVLNGRYGAYVTNGKKNVKIPKDLVPEELTENDAKKLLTQKVKPKKPKKSKKTTTKTKKKTGKK